MMRRTLPYVLIFVVVAIASFFAAEAFFRLCGDNPSDDLRGLFAQTEEGGYRLAGSVDTSAHWSAGYFTVFTDELGLRCDQKRRFGLRPGSSIDGLLIGDSQGFGNGVSFEDSLAGAAVILAAQAGVKLSNASVGGHSLGSQLNLSRSLTSVRGVTVRNYIFMLTPVLASNPDGVARAFVASDGKLYGSPPGRSIRAVTWLKSNLAVYSRLRDATRNLGVGSHPEDAGSHVLQLYTAGQDDSGLETRLAAALQRFQALAVGHDARIYLVYVPLTVEFEKTALESQAAFKGVVLDLSRPYRVCQAVADRLGAPLLDLRPVLQEFHLAARPLNLRGDFHYNADLSKACAAAFWAWLAPQLSPQQYPLSIATNHAR